LWLRKTTLLHGRNGPAARARFYGQNCHQPSDDTLPS
jgi:hypothetical protein